jgi:hypothetical protein
VAPVSPGARSDTVLFKALAFLAGLGLREILLFLAGHVAFSGSRVGPAVACLGFSLSLGVVAVRLLRGR